MQPDARTENSSTEIPDLLSSPPAPTSGPRDKGRGSGSSKAGTRLVRSFLNGCPRVMQVWEGGEKTPWSGALARPPRTPSQGILKTREQPLGVPHAPPPPPHLLYPRAAPKSDTPLWLSSGSCLQSIWLSLIPTDTQPCMGAPWPAGRLPLYLKLWQECSPLLCHLPSSLLLQHWQGGGHRASAGPLTWTKSHRTPLSTHCLPTAPGAQSCPGLGLGEVTLFL